MAKKRENMFAGRTSRSMEKPVSNFGYLKLPDNITMFKPEPATEVVFDILPYVVTDEEHMDNKKYDSDAVVGNLWWKRPIRVHRNVGPEDDTVICPTTFGNKCPICEYGSRRKKEGADWKEELSGIFPKNRTLFLVNMIDSSDLELDYEEGEIYIMDQSDKNFLETLDEQTKRDIDYQGFPDPYMGLSIRTYFKAKKIGKVKYGEASRIDFEERDEQYDEDYVASLPCLDDILKVMDYDEINALYFGMEGMDDAIDDAGEVVDDRPARRRKSTSKRESPRQRRSKPEVEDEPEVIEDEPKEKKKPARRKPAARKPKETAPEPEPEPEPEVEEKPKRRSRSKPKEEVDNPCPAGLRYGEDNDQFDACDTCKVWDACADEKEAE